MANKQQTAVQKLLEYIKGKGFDMEYEMEMSFIDIEKEQLMFAYFNGASDVHEKKYRGMEQYYKETYEK